MINQFPLLDIVSLLGYYTFLFNTHRYYEKALSKLLTFICLVSHGQLDFKENLIKIFKFMEIIIYIINHI